MSSANVDIAIAQLIVYIPLAPVTLYVFIRHVKLGVGAFLAWFYVQAFVMLQLVGGILTVATGKNSTSTTGSILTQVGIGPLILAAMGMLHERKTFTPLKDSFLFKLAAQIVFHVLMSVGTAILATGLSSLYSSNPSGHAHTDAKAGALVLTGLWLSLVCVVVYNVVATARRTVLRKLLAATVVVMPLLLLRLIYTLLSVFDTSSSTFNPLHPSTAAKVLLTIIPLDIASLVWITAGVLTVRELADAKRAKDLSDPQKAGQVANKLSSTGGSQV